MKQIIMLLLLFATSSQAQESFVTAGNTAVRNTGSIAYTLGQVFDNSYENDVQIMMVNEGVQQPYELFIIEDEEFLAKEEEEDLPDAITKSDIYLEDSYNARKIKNEYSVYPNPTSGTITLDIEKIEKETPYSYLIYDSQGRSMVTQKISSSQTSIDVSNLINGLYYLTVNERGMPVKSFKLLKISQ